MDSLFSFVDWVGDRIISVASRQRPSSHRRPYSSRPPTPPHLSYSRRLDRRSRSTPTAQNTPGERAHSNPTNKNNNQTADSSRYYRSSQRARNVHWGTITEIPRGISPPTTSGLNQYHQRRNNRNDDPAGSPSTGCSPPDSRSGSPSRTDSPRSIGSSSSYENQRYPNAWYSRSSSPSSHPQYPRHRTHVPRKPILKPPTPTDDEMLIRNLWEMVVLSDQRLDYMYEFLSGVLLVGDDILDTMLKTGELSMFEEATRHANRMGARQRARAFRPTRMPVPHAARERKRELPAHARSEGREPPGPVLRGPRELDIVEEEDDS